MDLSLCMILKNEATTIERAVLSAIGVVDEIVIGVDESCTDKTFEEVLRIQMNLTQTQINFHLSKFKFKDDFSQARNYFISKCKSSHVLILDGHEYLTDASILYINGLKEMQSPPDVVDINVSMQDGDGVILFQQPRIFKQSIKYQYAIHNAIMHEENRVTMPQIHVVHDQPISRLRNRQQQRSEINISGLRKLADEGDSRAMYYIAMQYYEEDKIYDAIKWYKKYLAASTFGEERYQARLYLATCYRKAKQNIEAIKTLLGCSNEDSFRNEHLIALGDVEFEAGLFKKALYFYRQAAAIKMPERFLILEQKHYTWFPWYKIMQAGLAMEDAEVVFEATKIGKQLGPMIKDFHEVENKTRDIIRQSIGTKRGSLYFVSSNAHFLMPILEEVKGLYHIRLTDSFSLESAQFADVIWCEWGDHNAIAVSNFQGKAKKILRIHAYEVFSESMKMINWDGFDLVIFVGDHIRKYLASKLMLSVIPDNWIVIPNGVDLTKFTIAENKSLTTNIAYAGYISNKKGANLLLSVAAELKHQGYDFHVAGEFQEDDIRQLFYAAKPKNMFLYGWQNDLNSFFSDKSFIINTSPRESQCLSVMQGMAAGLTPLVFDWIGAKEIYGKTWATVPELKELILDGKHIHPERNRRFVSDSYNWSSLKQKIISIIHLKVEEVQNGRQDSKVAV